MLLQDLISFAFQRDNLLKTVGVKFDYIPEILNKKFKVIEPLNDSKWVPLHLLNYYDLAILLGYRKLLVTNTLDGDMNRTWPSVFKLMLNPGLLTSPTWRVYNVHGVKYHFNYNTIANEEGIPLFCFMVHIGHQEQNPQSYYCYSNTRVLNVEAIINAQEFATNKAFASSFNRYLLPGIVNNGYKLTICDTSNIKLWNTVKTPTHLFHNEELIKNTLLNNLDLIYLA